MDKSPRQTTNKRLNPSVVGILVAMLVVFIFLFIRQVMGDSGNLMSLNTLVTAINNGTVKSVTVIDNATLRIITTDGQQYNSAKEQSKPLPEILTTLGVN